MEPTPEDLKNGWTPETLTTYHADRAKAHNQSINFRPKPMPTRGDRSGYRPARWRR